MKRKIIAFICLFSVIQSGIIKAQNKNVVAQFSVLPGLTTNGDHAKEITNNISFNLFAGHNGGVNGFELGAFANIIEQDVVGGQIAGISNVVKGQTEALQVAGIVNYNAKSFKGIQASGICNIVEDEFLGMQVSGIFNGTQLVYGAQITGITGLAKDVYGLQVNGIGGNADNVIGMQVSGIINHSKSIEGMQLAGIVNVTGELIGVQLGFINVSENAKNGVPIGFVSFSKNGYKTVDVYTSEIFPATLSLKTGVNAFYNVFSASSSFNTDKHLWSVGYGFGSRFHITRNTLMEFEIVASQLSENEFEETINMLGRFNMNFAFQLGRIGEIYAGPSLNVYATQVYNPDTEIYGHGIAPDNTFYSEVVYDFDNPTFIQGWIGGQIGIRL